MKYKTVYFDINRYSFPGCSCGLGDLLSVFYSLENLGIQKSIIFILNFNKINIANEIFNSFKFKNIVLDQYKKKEDIIEKVYTLSFKKDCSCDYGLFNGCFFICCFLDYLIKKYEYNPFLSQPIESIFNNEKKFNKLTYIQFDKKSNHLKKMKEYTDIEIKSFLKNKDYHCLGGYDTKKYLKNANYCLGNFEFIIKKLISSNDFIGIDSGISHLAGAMGINSTIYLKNYSPCIFDFYTKSYRNSKILYKKFKIF